MKKEDLPSYLNCPWCPAQAHVTRTDMFLVLGFGIQGYKCISGHKFFVEIDEMEEKC